MAVKCAINGFGRIGRLLLRAGLKKPNLEIVAINDLFDAQELAYSLRWDSIHGPFDGTVTVEGRNLIVNGKSIPVYAERNPADLPWESLGVEIVAEATGFFVDRDGASRHLSAGAKRVVITAPAKNPDVTVVLGVNDEDLDLSKHRIISNASCTTNALAPVAYVLNREFGIHTGLLNTVHAYTQNQLLLDGPNKKHRRGRAAALNLVPTTTGAAKAIGLVLPDLNGKMDGLALRTPNPDGSIVDLTAWLNRETTAEEVNAAMKKASEEERFQGILAYSEDELVSSDIVGNSHSSIFEPSSTIAIGKLVKVLAWYDNEWGYSNRIIDLMLRIAE